jgi:CubicO group peptidase (beta-lactamase class C family)
MTAGFVRDPRNDDYIMWHMTLFLRVLILGGCLVALEFTVTAMRQDPAARIDAVVRAEMTRQKIPGVAVAAIHRGKAVRVQGYGEANVEHHVPVRPETIFQSGSLGKMFTAAGVMLLVGDGVLRIDEPVTRFFPDAPAAWSAITVRHLLTHTSGIPDYTDESFDYRKDYSEEELAKLAYSLELEFPPGSRWNYSNTGYVLLGMIIRKTSGRFYGDVLRNRIFTPTGMKTARVITEEDIVPNRAAGYRLVEGELKNQEWVSPQLNTTADGSLYLSLLDLVAWEETVRSRRILNTGWDEILQPVKLASGRRYPYGFGWAIDDVAGQPVHQHGGAWQGFKTHLARYLQDDLTIIVLANLAQAEPDRIVEAVAALFNPRLARAEPAPIEDREPDVTQRLEALLAAARDGRLNRGDFAYVRAGFFPEAAERYQKLLARVGAARRIALVERKELGDDRIYGYRVEFAGAAMAVTLGLAPDDKISTFSIRTIEGS